MKKRLLALTLAGALLLSGCSGLKTRQPDEDALPELEYTRPENEKIENRESQKTLKSQGTLSDGIIRSNAAGKYTHAVIGGISGHGT